MVPASIPMPAPAAKPAPWSSARKSATGPDVKGSPTSQPPTAGPQRRPARLAAPIRAGVTMSFSARVCTWPALTSSGLAGLDEAGLVSQDDRLDTVAETQLGEDPGHVRLHGGL